MNIKRSYFTRISYQLTSKLVSDGQHERGITISDCGFCCGSYLYYDTSTQPLRTTQLSWIIFTNNHFTHTYQMAILTLYQVRQTLSFIRAHTCCDRHNIKTLFSLSHIHTHIHTHLFFTRRSIFLAVALLKKLLLV